ncbi:MAG TPA: glycosyl hydrolase family 18 protein, partial [Clostridia bacterium]|nr:glycosyl hydrolase family 18 protein [Clostridia bacterium]
ALFAAVLLIFSGFSGTFGVEAADTDFPYEVEKFSDVPEGHWAYEPVHYFRYLNITQGMGGNKFGLGQPVKKGEFISMLVRLMGWELIETQDTSFSDVSRDKWYYPYIETALAHGAILKGSGSFGPDNQITRLELAEAIVRTLGYGELAGQLKYLPGEFQDVTVGAEFTNMVKDFAITNGADGKSFLPESTAKKEDAVTMLVRMYQKLNSKLEELHGFYAIKSYDQAGLIQELSSVSFGWSRLEYDESSGGFTVAVTQDGKSDFFIPSGYSEPVSLAKQYSLPIQLNIFASNETKIKDPSTGQQLGMVEYLLSDAGAQEQVINQVAQLMNNTTVENDSIAFDGVVIDFENLRGEKLKQLYSEFLLKLKDRLTPENKKLYVAVHPQRGNGQAYYDGYDYRAIGEIADRIILMAHDYNAVSLTESEMAMGYNDTPLTPISEVYYALKAITDEETGVPDPSKVWLQLSFDTVQWKLVDGKVVNQKAYRPAYAQIWERMNKNEPGSDLSIKYSDRLQNPFLTYYNAGDGTDNIIWYEDSRSVNAKIELAKMFGIKGISLWRLGIIPDFEAAGAGGMGLDVWQNIKEHME